MSGGREEGRDGGLNVEEEGEGEGEGEVEGEREDWGQKQEEKKEEEEGEGWVNGETNGAHQQHRTLRLLIQCRVAPVALVLWIFVRKTALASVRPMTSGTNLARMRCIVKGLRGWLLRCVPEGLYKVCVCSLANLATARL